MSNAVMVPLDGSDKDGRAVAVARALADLSGAGLHLVRVLEPPAGDATAHAGARADPPDRTRALLRGLADRVSADTGRPVSWEVIEGRDVAGQLVRHAADRDARLVVMATRAPNAAARALRGSVADQVMRESPRPVVLVPPGTDDMRGRRVQIARVLVPQDGSALAAKAVDHLLGLPVAHQLEYVLLQAVPERDERARTQAERDLETIAGRIRARGAPVVEVRVVEARDPAPAITSVVRDVLVDLIAMSTRGAGGLPRMVLGSVAEGVVRASEVPVLLLTPAYLGASGT